VTGGQGRETCLVYVAISIEKLLYLLSGLELGGILRDAEQGLDERAGYGFNLVSYFA
jgi:hypothetical protein